MTSLFLGCDGNEDIVELPPYFLSGYTRQSPAGATLDEVNVFFQDTLLVATSDANGYFHFPASFYLYPEGEFSFRKVGFHEVKFVFPGEARRDSLDCHVYLADISLFPV